MQNQGTTLDRQRPQATGHQERAQVAIADAVVPALPFKPLTIGSAKPADPLKLQAPLAGSNLQGWRAVRARRNLWPLLAITGLDPHRWLTDRKGKRQFRKTQITADLHPEGGAAIVQRHQQGLVRLSMGRSMSKHNPPSGF